MSSYAVWSEFTPYSELHASLEQLRRLDCGLYLAVHEESLFDEELYDFLRAASSRGVEVRPWLLLRKEKGYWPNRWNLEEFRDYFLKFFNECRQRGIALDWVILDVEPHLSFMLELEKLLWDKRLLAAWKLINCWNRKVPSGSMKELVKTIHDHGLRVHAVTLPMVLDDMLVGQGQLQRLLGVPLEGVSWDEISFMVYRPYFWDYLRGLSSEVVESYAKDAKHFFQDKASIALGPIGRYGVTQSPHHFRFPSELHEDLVAGRRAGIQRFSLFCLEGIQAEGGLDHFLARPDPLDGQWDWRVQLLRLAIKWGLKLLR